MSVLRIKYLYAEQHKDPSVRILLTPEGRFRNHSFAVLGCIGCSTEIAYTLVIENNILYDQTLEYMHWRYIVCICSGYTHNTR